MAWNEEKTCADATGFKFPYETSRYRPETAESDCRGLDGVAVWQAFTSPELAIGINGEDVPVWKGFGEQAADMVASLATGDPLPSVPAEPWRYADDKTAREVGKNTWNKKGVELSEGHKKWMARLEAGDLSGPVTPLDAFLETRASGPLASNPRESET